MVTRAIGLLAMFVACGQSTGVSGDDTGTSVDAIDNGSGSGSGTPLTVDTITCDTHTRTETKADGSRTETKTYFKLVTLSMDADFYVESCGYTYTYFPTGSALACPAGSTCTDTGPALPASQDICYANHLGAFVNGQIYISCGSGTFNYNASNVLTSSSELKYTSVKLHH
jgi:hypothetical protein